MVREVQKEDEPWLRELFQKSGALGSFQLAWFSYWKKNTVRHKWLCIEKKGFVHYLIKKDNMVNIYEMYSSGSKKVALDLIREIKYPCEVKVPRDSVQLNAMYKSLRFVLLGTVREKKNGNSLNVYRRWL